MMKKRCYKERYRKNRKVLLQKAKDYYHKKKEDPSFKEKRKETNKKWREENKARYKELQKKWREDNEKKFKVLDYGENGYKIIYGKKKYNEHLEKISKEEIYTNETFQKKYISRLWRYETVIY
jgi:nitrate/nitrite-specific signal transduction histidine kinase